jgi:hypothetical protein
MISIYYATEKTTRRYPKRRNKKQNDEVFFYVQRSEVGRLPVVVPF